MTREAFRALVNDELQSMGWPPKSYAWAAPGKLALVVNGQLRIMKLHANMGHKKLNRALGYLHGMADVLGLEAA